MFGLICWNTGHVMFTNFTKHVSYILGCILCYESLQKIVGKIVHGANETLPREHLLWYHPG